MPGKRRTGRRSEASKTPPRTSSPKSHVGPPSILIQEEPAVMACWLAGTLSEKEFLKKHPNRTIPGIDTTSVCKMLTNANHPIKKLSFHARSLLLKGVTVINTLQDQMLRSDISSFLEEIKKATTDSPRIIPSMSGDDFPDLGLRDEPLPHVPDNNEELINAAKNAVKNAKLITMEEPPCFAVPQLQDTGFGELSYASLDLMDVDEFLPESQIFTGAQEMITEDGSTGQTQLYPSVEEGRDEIVKTPSKRKTGQLGDQDLTPSKRSRVSRTLQFDDDSVHETLGDLTGVPVDAASQDVPNDKEPPVAEKDNLENPSVEENNSAAPIVPAVDDSNETSLNLGNLDLNNPPPALKQKRPVPILSAAARIDVQKFSAALNTRDIHTVKWEAKIVDVSKMYRCADTLMVNPIMTWDEKRIIEIGHHLQLAFSQEAPKLTRKTRLPPQGNEPEVRETTADNAEQDQSNPFGTVQDSTVASSIEKSHVSVMPTVPISQFETEEVEAPLQEEAAVQQEAVVHEETAVQGETAIDDFDDDFELLCRDFKKMTHEYLNMEHRTGQDFSKPEFYEKTKNMINDLADEGLFPMLFEDLCPIEISTRAEAVATLEVLLAKTAEENPRVELKQSQRDEEMDRIWIVPTHF